MFTIFGSGFGIYGYLPALAEHLGEEVVLPKAYETKVRSRPELGGTLSRIRWVKDHDEALALADGAVIATPPQFQGGIVERCLSLPNIKRLALEKPLAVTPGLAASLLSRLDASGVQYVIAYTPSDLSLDGSYRQIRVLVDGPNRPVARTRTGYYATPEPRQKAQISAPAVTP